MVKTYIVKVFVDEFGNHGDNVRIVLDQDRKLTSSERIQIAKKKGSVETAFINDLESRSISIVHPQGEISFAGTVA